jgi:hypothetical protein
MKTIGRPILLVAIVLTATALVSRPVWTFHSGANFVAPHQGVFRSIVSRIELNAGVPSFCSQTSRCGDTLDRLRLQE